MKKAFFMFLFLLWTVLQTFSQVSVNTDGNAADPSAMLDVKSTNRGVLVSRMTTDQISSVVSPADGLMAYNTDDGKLYIFVASDTIWKEVSYGPGTIGTFSCGNPFVDTRDNKTYHSVLIGNQCWMKENLNYGTIIAGNQNMENNGIAEKYCYQNFDPFCDIYGGLYQWAEMVQYLNGATNYESWNPLPSGNVQGLCMDNWHVATNDEWVVLREFLGGSGSAGGALKETGFDHWALPNTGATNSSSFTALPGGKRSSAGEFQNLATRAWFWTASEAFPALGWLWNLANDSGDLGQYPQDKQDGFSVRCVHD